MENRLVSVVIAAYNVEEYIGRCINSILKQTYSNIEIIIVDDGSKDRTVEVIETFISKGVDIKLIKQANGGVSKARNKALEFVTGDLICIFDSDDFMNSDHIETLVSLYSNAGDIDCAITGYAQYSNKNDSIIKKVESTEGLFEGRELADRLMFHRGNENLIAGVNNKLYSTAIINKFDIKYNEKLAYGEDWLFNIIYYMHCRKVAISNYVTSNYVQYEESRLSTNFRPDGYLYSIYTRKFLNNLFPGVYDGNKYLKSILRTTDYYNKYYVRSRGFSGFKDYCKNMVTLINDENLIPEIPTDSSKMSCRHEALIDNKCDLYLLLNLLFCIDTYLKYFISRLFRRG